MIRRRGRALSGKDPVDLCNEVQADSADVRRPCQQLPHGPGARELRNVDPANTEVPDEDEARVAGATAIDRNGFAEEPLVDSVEEDRIQGPTKRMPSRRIATMSEAKNRTSSRTTASFPWASRSSAPDIRGISRT